MRALPALILVACPQPTPRPAPPAILSAPAAPEMGECVAEAPPAPEPPRGRSPHDPIAKPAPDRPGDLCEPARATLDRAAEEILGAPDAEPAAVRRRAAWDGRGEPARLARIAQRFGLGAAARERLARNGFVVSAGVTFPHYVEAYHEIFQSQLPVYVSVDSVLHAIHASHQGLLGDLERAVLSPRLSETLSKLHCALPSLAPELPAEVARDLDLYLTVARTLLAGRDVPSVSGVDAEARRLVALVNEAPGLRELELFGRRRWVDLGAFRPRGHYLRGLEGWFRAMMWLSRIELNLVSRSSRSSTLAVDPRETPREVALALGLAELAERSGALGDVTALDEVWTAFAGAREDVSLAELVTLRRQAGIAAISAEAAPRLAAAVGDRFRRTTPLHPHPDGAGELPVIASFLGPRVLPDSAAVMPLVQPAVPDRVMVGAADVAYVLGHDRAKGYLAAERARFPRLDAQLDEARAALDQRLGGGDLYSAWLGAIRALARRPAGALPSFMDREAFAELRLASAVAAFGQLRHGHVLVGGMAYLGAGCEIPDGYVEPAADVYDALIAYADRGAALLDRLDPEDRARSREYFERLGRTLRILRRIVATELAGQPLSDAQRRWLSMIVEIVVDDSGSGAPPTYSGWYFDLYRGFDDATADASFVSDYAFSAEEAAYVGAGAPRLGVFVIDSGGPPRAVAGPVAHAYEAHLPLEGGRLADEDDVGQAAREPWAAATTLPAPVEPDVTVALDWDDRSHVFVITAPREVGAVTVELLDHHRQPLVSRTVRVGAGETRLRFGRAASAEHVHLRVGDFHAWGALLRAGGDGGFYFEKRKGPPDQ